VGFDNRHQRTTVFRLNLARASTLGHRASSWL
jgi:hypothetical protein